MNNSRFAALVICAAVAFVSTESLAQQQKTGGFVKIPIEDILTTKSLKTVVTADEGWVFGYDQVGYMKKMPIEDISETESYAGRVPMAGTFDRDAIWDMETIDSGYAIGYDYDGNVVKLSISLIPEASWRSFRRGNVKVGSGYVVRRGDLLFGYNPQGCTKISISDIPDLRLGSLNVMYGAEDGYIIGFTGMPESVYKIPIGAIPETSLSHLTTIVSADSGYAMGVDDHGRLMKVPLSELELGYASSLANKIIDADSGFVICRVVG